MAAVLTADSGDTESISTFVAECERMKIAVLPPDVNESGSDFTVAGERTIRFGLSTIKNFGEGISEAVMTERKKAPFTSLSDFLSRVQAKSLNRKSLECLIKVGALDSLAGEHGRSYLLYHIETLLAFHKDSTTDAPQDSLFGVGHLAPAELKLPAGNHPTLLKDKLEWEKELLGIYVSGHPLDSHGDKTAKASTTIAALKAEPEKGRSVILPVLVQEVRTILTKNGEKMAFVKFEDKTAGIEGVIFPKIFKEHSALITPGTCLLIKATISTRSGEVSLAIENVKAL
jgi:DNA polymerase-3 subunit alpha